MKYEVTSMNTKKMLAQSLKNLVSTKSFSKVTVSELIADCGVNRKTFYYHFEDLYALLVWTLEQEAIEVVKRFDLIAEYEEAILFVMDYMEANEVFLANIFNSLARDEVRRFLAADFHEVVGSFIDTTENALGLSVPADYKHFLRGFYTEAIAGMLVEWIIDHPTRNREKTVQYLSIIVKSAIPHALQAALT